MNPTIAGSFVGIGLVRDHGIRQLPHPPQCVPVGIVPASAQPQPDAVPKWFVALNIFPGAITMFSARQTRNSSSESMLCGSSTQRINPPCGSVTRVPAGKCRAINPRASSTRVATVARN
ncbi:hypothetical protein AJ88_00070 [Mesorhizobium amorphae CCBAU 01583]|nr:hypothetical protein AJ88_00070 [Mesorhizobium amorphae CCBAU 01583]